MQFYISICQLYLLWLFHSKFSKLIEWSKQNKKKSIIKFHFSTLSLIYCRYFIIQLFKVVIPQFIIIICHISCRTKNIFQTFLCKSIAFLCKAIFICMRLNKLHLIKRTYISKLSLNTDLKEFHSIIKF
jgi:hypothetical protein